MTGLVVVIDVSRIHTDLDQGRVLKYPGVEPAYEFLRSSREH
jgi:hypothetical protein